MASSETSKRSLISRVGQVEECIIDALKTAGLMHSCCIERKRQDRRSEMFNTYGANDASMSANPAVDALFGCFPSSGPAPTMYDLFGGLKRLAA